MILPFSGMSFAATDDVKEQKINELGNAFGDLYLQYIEEYDPKAKSDLKRQMDVLVKQLEEYGITYTEKWERNKAYWAEKSSEYIDKEIKLSTSGNLLPSAFASADPYFYAGYAYGCWWVLTCHDWNSNAIQLGEGDIGTRTVYLASDYAWSEGAYRVTGSGLAVNFIYSGKLMDNSLTKQSVSDTAYSIFYNKNVVIETFGDRFDYPEEGWNYTIQLRVTNIE